MFVVDSNVLIHAAQANSPRSAQARGLIDGWVARGDRIFLTWGIVYEFLRVTTHRRAFSSPLTFAAAASAVEGLLARPSVTVIVETAEHRALLLAAQREIPGLSGSRFHDLHTAVLMREHGIVEIRTEDTDFHRFPWVKPANPFRA